MFLNELKTEKNDSEVKLILRDSVFEIILMAAVVLILYTFFYQLPVWVLVITGVLFAAFLFKKNELIFNKKKGRCIKRTTFLGVAVGKTTAFDFSEDDLFFDFVILTDSSVGQKYYYRLCLKEKEEQLLLFENKATVNKVETALIESGVVKSELLKINF